MSKLERCWECDALTGRGGQADDSLYTDDGHGPFCEECWDEVLACQVPADPANRPGAKEEAKP